MRISKMLLLFYKKLCRNAANLQTMKGNNNRGAKDTLAVKK